MRVVVAKRWSAELGEISDEATPGDAAGARQSLSAHTTCVPLPDMQTFSWKTYLPRIVLCKACGFVRMVKWKLKCLLFM